MNTVHIITHNPNSSVLTNPSPAGMVKEKIRITLNYQCMLPLIVNQKMVVKPKMPVMGYHKLWFMFDLVKMRKMRGEIWGGTQARQWRKH